ncbi:hypothetical protein ACFYYM_37665 [Streptomyces erythrochromogenes]|uniref:hypothetical protein n=1 Tax=Streptomyces erythrochromogenes TaxID=285574 RepID=UPI003685B426
MAAAESQLPHDLVLDGELVVWDTGAGRLSFEALERRTATRARGAATRARGAATRARGAATRARGAAGLAARWPAYFVAFDRAHAGLPERSSGDVRASW